VKNITKCKFQHIDFLFAVMARKFLALICLTIWNKQYNLKILTLSTPLSRLFFL